MRTFTKSDFMQDGAELVSEASTLGFPPGTSLKEFKVKGFEIFTRVKTQLLGADVAFWVYANVDGICARVFND